MPVKKVTLLNKKSGMGATVVFVNGFLSEDKLSIKNWENELVLIYPVNPWIYYKWLSRKIRPYIHYLSDYCILYSFLPSASGIPIDFL